MGVLDPLVELLRGLWITLKSAGERPVTFQYPEEKRPVRPRFRGRHELKRYVERMTGDIKKIAVVHGEESQALAFVETLKQMKPKAEVFAPVYRQTAEF